MYTEIGSVNPDWNSVTQTYLLLWEWVDSAINMWLHLCSSSGLVYQNYIFCQGLKYVLDALIHSSGCCKVLSANSTLVLEEWEHKIPTNVCLCCAILCIVKLIIPANDNIYYKNIVVLIMQKGQVGNNPPENFEEPYIGSLGLFYTEPRVDGLI